MPRGHPAAKTPRETAAAQASAHAPERIAWLALLPPAVTVGFYLLPAAAQEIRLFQFAPQLIGYAALAAWIQANPLPLARLGFHRSGVAAGLRLGIVTGLVLGSLNSAVILAGAPALGIDITFLRDTPHAHIPLVVMLPWSIMAIAAFVELNFRGFQLGRLAELLRGPCGAAAPVLACLLSAVSFAFDPFMVTTFRALHWIALWDGVIWGMLWVRHRNLTATIAAHAVEVVLLYSSVRFWLER